MQYRIDQIKGPSEYKVAARSLCGMFGSLGNEQSSSISKEDEEVMDHKQRNCHSLHARLEISKTVRGLRLPTNNQFLLNHYLAAGLFVRVDHWRYIDRYAFQFGRDRAANTKSEQEIFNGSDAEREAFRSQLRQLRLVVAGSTKGGPAEAEDEYKDKQMQIFRKNCALVDIDLLRMKLHFQPVQTAQHRHDCARCSDNQLGCVERASFLIVRAGRPYQCKVYKRIREVQVTDVLDKTKDRRRIHDWKVKVFQLTPPYSWDYVVLRRLPVPVEQMQDHVSKEEHLAVELNERVEPAPILKIKYGFEVKQSNGDGSSQGRYVAVRSQRGLDHIAQQIATRSQESFDLVYKNSLYFSVDPDDGKVSIPSVELQGGGAEQATIASESETADSENRQSGTHLYEVQIHTVAHKEGRTIGGKSITKYKRYSTEAYQARRRQAAQAFVSNVIGKAASDAGYAAGQEGKAAVESIVADESDSDLEDAGAIGDPRCTEHVHPEHNPMFQNLAELYEPE